VKVAFLIFAVCGFCASLLTHLTTFFGINPAKYVPWVWVLHLGIFIAMIPLLIAQRKKGFWPLFAHLPRWARYAIKGFFVYAFLNFALFFFLSGGGVLQFAMGSTSCIVTDKSSENFRSRNMNFNALMS
jgi:hypothetical protein